jgi:hypothetical protein
VDAPILHYDIPLRPKDGPFGQWLATVDYIVWSGYFEDADPPLSIWELYEGGAVRIPERDDLMHVIPGGTPYHIEHLFGYWRICDADMVYFRTRQEGQVYYLLVAGGRPGNYTHDTLLWVCPKCAARFNRHEFETGKVAWKRFWDAELDRVRAFNDDAALRTCPDCAHLHPPGYGFYPSSDNAAEAEARTRW